MMPTPAIALTPIVAKRKHTGPCADHVCGEEIVKGDLIIVYEDFGQDRHLHMEHWLEQVRHQYEGRIEQARRLERLTERILENLSAVAAVEPGWVSRQYQALQENRVY